MINSDLISLLIFISLPFLIDKGREFIRQRALNLQKPKRNKTKFDYFIIILLLYLITTVSLMIFQGFVLC